MQNCELLTQSQVATKLARLDKRARRKQLKMWTAFIRTFWGHHAAWHDAARRKSIVKRRRILSI